MDTSMHIASKRKTAQAVAGFRQIIGFALIALVVLAIGLTLFVEFTRNTSVKPSALTVGSKAAAFNLKAARGGTISLDSLKGKAFILSFIRVSNDFENKETQASRAQLNFIKSMETQYSSRGMKFIIVDVSYLTSGRGTDTNQLINFSYDWKLEQIPLLMDSKSKGMAQKYGVSYLPTTFLIDKMGVITQRWDGVALSYQLASSIEQSLDGKESMGKYQITAAQSIFKGLDAARQLSPNLWLVDGGKDWDSEAQTATKLLAVGLSGKLQVQVTAENLETYEKVDVYSGEMEVVPEK
jgi:peroxiredoxin